MLLTIKQPPHQGYKSSHEYTPPTPPPTCRFSPAVTTGTSLPPIPTLQKSLPPLPATNSAMSTHHRGLPPPAAMIPQSQQQTLQQQPPSIGQPPLSQPMGQLPAPPQQWQGAEESMRNWLHAKAEEDKRKQEEEKTRQEALRLEQRKIEQTMLQTSLEGGIPPYMIPMVFSGMGGGNLPNASLEWAQHYMQQAHHLQQQQHVQQPQLLPSSQQSPEQLQRRDSRDISQSYPGQQPQATVTLPSTPIGPTGSQSTFLPGYPMSPTSRSRPIAQAQSVIPRPPQMSQLPRLNTGEMHIQPPPPGSSVHILPGQPGHPLQQSQTAQQESQSSPSIYFHHWQPPTSQGNTGAANQPSTPLDHTQSPKKRKATGPHQSAPPPTSQPQYTSPPVSQTGSSSVSNTPQSRRRGHSRQRSDMSSRELDSYGRPTSRNRHTESGFSTQSFVSPPTGTEQAAAPAEPPRRRSGGSHPVSSLLEESDTRPLSVSQSQGQQIRGIEPQYSAGLETRREEQHKSPPEGEEARRVKAMKRDDGRD